MYLATQEICGAEGLESYEVSNHAKPGAESRHNMVYWRYGDYVGIGPGAHGRLALGSPDSRDDRGTHQIHNPDRWLEKVESQGHGTAKRRKLAARDRARERIIMGLRLSEGMDRGRFRAQTGAEVLDFIDDRALAASLDEGYVTLDDGRLAATAEGRLRLNGLLAALLRDDEN